MNKQFTISALLAAIACTGLTAVSSAHAADFPEMQVGTMIVASGSAAPSADTANDSSAEQDSGETEESTS